MSTLRHARLAELNGLLATAVERGLSLEPAVELLASQAASPRLRDLLARVATGLREGRPLPEAMEAVGSFAPEYLAHLRAGIAAGRLGTVLRRAEAYHALRARVRARIQGFALYIAGGLAFSVGVTGLVSFMAVPMTGSVDSIYEEWQISDLPVPHRLSRRLPTAAAVLGASFVGIALLGAAAGTYLSRRRAGYWVPAWGRMIKSRDLSLMCGVVAMRLDGGASLADALESAGAAVPNRHFRNRLRRVRERVLEGARLSDALFESRFFPRALAWAVSLGESRGDLPAILASFTEVYTARMERDFEVLLMLLTPLGILALGNVGLLASVSLLAPFFAILRVTSQI